jgi:transcription-repair coupling factor (superfamily II helicase)
MVLQRAELLNELKNAQAAARLVVSYPEALCEKVINRKSLEKNTLEITEGAKLDIEFIADFLTDYEFDRVDFVYAPGQFAVRGGIVDIFSFLVLGQESFFSFPTFPTRVSLSHCLDSRRVAFIFFTLLVIIWI